jgi:hypothetical protein
VVRGRTTSNEWKVRVEARIDGDDGRHVGRSRADVSSAWKTLVTPISTPGVIEVRFAARGNAADLQEGFTVWAGPEILTRRRVGEARRRLVKALRHYGLRGSVARLKTRAGGLTRQSYDEWISRQTPTADELAAMRREAEGLEYKPAIAVLLRSRGDGNELRRSCASLVSQAYPLWEAWVYQEQGSVALDADFGRDPRFFVLPAGTSAASLRNAALARTGAAFVASLDAPDELGPHALYEFAKVINVESGVDLLYSDEDRVVRDGSCGDFKPGWSPEYLLSRDYLGRLTAIRKSVLEQIGGYSERAGEAIDYDAALRATARSARVRHVPKVLYHRRTAPAASLVDDERRTLERFCAESGRAATIVPAGPRIWRVKHRLSERPRVTLVIPTDARAANRSGEALVTQCVRSVLERTTYRNFDLLLVDNGQLPNELLELLEDVPHARATYSWTGAFNFSRKINYAVSHVSAEYVVLLNDDIEVIGPEWLEAMMEYRSGRDWGGRRRIGLTAGCSTLAS